MQQVWKCDGCGTERQWGSVSLAAVRGAVEEANQEAIARAEWRKTSPPALQVVTEKPILGCAGCKGTTPHTFVRDQVQYDPQLNHPRMPEHKHLHHAVPMGA